MRIIVRNAFALPAALAVALGACQGNPELGKGGSMVKGSAGDAGAKEAAVELARCDQPLGLASLMEPSSDVALVLQKNLNLQSPVPLLRLMMAQSNCFQVVDSQAVNDPGTASKVHYMIRPNIVFSDQTGGYGGLAAVGSAFGWVGALAGAAAGSMKIQEAQTVLFLNDAKTGLQKAAAEGSATVKDFGGVGGLGGIGGGLGGIGGVGGYGRTPEGKLITAAFVDAYNKLVDQIRGSAPQVDASSPSPSREPPAFESGSDYTSTLQLNVRADPGTDAEIITAVQPGDTWTTTGERQGNWWKIKNGTHTGWVSARYLRAETNP